MDYAWIVTATLCIIILYILYSVLNEDMDYWKRHGFPYVKTLPIFGNMFELVLGRKGFPDIATEIYKSTEGEKFVGFMTFKFPMLLIRDMELVHHILIKDFSYFQDRLLPIQENSEIIAAGLPFMTGDRWRVLRHKLTPSFTSGKLKMMYNQIKKCSDEVVIYLRDKSNKDLEAKDLITKFKLNLIGRISFGIEVDAFTENEKENEFFQNGKTLFSTSVITQMKLFFTSATPNLSKILRMRIVDTKVNDYFRKLIQDLIDYRKVNEIKRNDFLQLMLDKQERERLILSPNFVETETALTDDTLNLEEPEDLELMEHLKGVKYDTNMAIFSDHIIAAQSFIFITGGAETVASVLSFTLYELAVNKNILRRLQEEVDSVLEKCELTYYSLKQMTYLENVIYEVMRMRPTVSIITRIASEDYTIPGTDKVIEKGKYILIPVRGIHYDPKYYPEPETFNPDRFEKIKPFPKGVYFPFGGGPRMCIASRLAMLEMKTLLAVLISKYTFRLSDKTRHPIKLDHRSFLPAALDGVWIKFEPRNDLKHVDKTF